jgi:hypothetical protein
MTASTKARELVDAFDDGKQDSARQLLEYIARLEAVADAARAECAKFNFPDEDRPELHAALAALGAR